MRQRDDSTLIIWDENLENIHALCNEFEEKNMHLIWRLQKSTPSTPIATPTASRPVSPSQSEAELNEKRQSDPDLPNTDIKTQVLGRRWWRRAPARERTEKEIKLGRMARSMKLYSPVYIGLAAGGAACEFASGHLSPRLTRFSFHHPRCWHAVRAVCIGRQGVPVRFDFDDSIFILHISGVYSCH